MKRSRSSSNSEEQQDQLLVGAAVVDRPSLFHMESILMVLQRYLPTSALIWLSCVNKRMNTTWISDERRLGVLHMKERILELTGREYKVKNPVKSIRKACLKSVNEPEEGAKKFYCWICRKPRSVKKLTLKRKQWPCATCLECAKKSMKRNYVEMDDVFYHVENKSYGPGWNERLYNEWLSSNRERITSMIRQQAFMVFFNTYNLKRYVHLSHIEPFIDEAQKASILK